MGAFVRKLNEAFEYPLAILIAFMLWYLASTLHFGGIGSALLILEGICMMHIGIGSVEAGA